VTADEHVPFCAGQRHRPTTRTSARRRRCRAKRLITIVIVSLGVDLWALLSHHAGLRTHSRTHHPGRSLASKTTDFQKTFLDSLSPKELAKFNLTRAKLAKLRREAGG